jgi:hypothetical protein
MDQSRYSEEDFTSFLQELIVNKRLNEAKEYGIAKLVIDKGFESLSDKQKFVFEKSIEFYVNDKCSRCGIEIPWCEMSADEDNSQMCSWCQQLNSHND